MSQHKQARRVKEELRLSEPETQQRLEEMDKLLRQVIERDNNRKV